MAGGYVIERNFEAFKVLEDGKTIFTIDDSPILKIEVTPATFHMFIDKDSFVDYGTH